MVILLREAEDQDLHQFRGTSPKLLGCESTRDHRLNTAQELLGCESMREHRLSTAPKLLECESMRVSDANHRLPHSPKTVCAPYIRWKMSARHRKVSPSEPMDGSAKQDSPSIRTAVKPEFLRTVVPHRSNDRCISVENCANGEGGLPETTSLPKRFPKTASLLERCLKTLKRTAAHLPQHQDIAEGNLHGVPLTPASSPRSTSSHDSRTAAHLAQHQVKNIAEGNTGRKSKNKGGKKMFRQSIKGCKKMSTQSSDEQTIVPETYSDNASHTLHLSPRQQAKVRRYSSVNLTPLPVIMEPATSFSLSLDWDSDEEDELAFQEIVSVRREIPLVASFPPILDRLLGPSRS